MTSASSGQKTKGEVYAESVNAIVGIKAEGTKEVTTIFGRTAQAPFTSTGSGFFITESGYIVTNYHVVANSKALSVIFSSVESKLESQNAQSDLRGELAGDSSELDANASIPSATVKGYNSDKDLAVIAVALKDIPEDVLSEGQTVEAKITAIDEEKQKISLSIRALLAPAADEEDAPVEE